MLVLFVAFLRLPQPQEQTFCQPRVSWSRSLATGWRWGVALVAGEQGHSWHKALLVSEPPPAAGEHPPPAPAGHHAILKMFFHSFTRCFFLFLFL